MRIATYQTGVDILGFPIYVEHRIYEGKTAVNKINKKQASWLVVESKTVKQH